MLLNLLGAVECNAETDSAETPWFCCVTLWVNNVCCCCRYGLIIPSRAAKSKPVVNTVSVFGSDDDEDDQVCTCQWESNLFIAFLAYFTCADSFRH